MRKILVFGLKNMIGGIESYLMTMQNQLWNSVSFHYIVEIKKDEPFIYEKEILEQKGNISKIPERHRIGSFLSELVILLKKNRKETKILYVNIDHISFDIIIILMGMMFGYKVIVHSHNAGLEPLKGFKYKLRQGICNPLGKAVLFLCPVKRLAVSRRAGKYLFLGKKYEILPPAISPEKYLFDIEKRSLMREKIGIKENEFAVGFIGRLSAVKNPFFLLDTIKEMKKSSEKVKLIIMGDGELKKQLMEYANKNQIADITYFAGNVDNVFDHLQAVDLLLATSLSEGMPIALIEAQAAGVPCLCAEKNYPIEIKITDLVEFLPLRSGKRKWAESCMEYSKKVNVADRRSANRKVVDSLFNVVNTAQKLERICEDQFYGSSEKKK